MAASRAVTSPASLRLGRASRRDLLLDAAADLLVSGGVDAVTMDGVAASAGVSRPLVYKHFPNRKDLLSALYQREATALEAEVTAALAGVEGLEPVVRATVAAVVDGMLRRGRIMGPLVRDDLVEGHLQREQQARNRRNMRWYTRLAVTELGLAQDDAEAAMPVYFNGLAVAMATWRSGRSRADRQRFVDLYTTLVLGGLRALAPPRVS